MQSNLTTVGGIGIGIALLQVNLVSHVSAHIAGAIYYLPPYSHAILRLTYHTFIVWHAQTLIPKQFGGGIIFRRLFLKTFFFAAWDKNEDYQ